MSKRRLADVSKPREVKVARKEVASSSTKSSESSSKLLGVNKAEYKRLLEVEKGGQPWKLWGPYLSERQWATVREDESADGSCWEYLSYEDAVYCAYKSGEDGLMGLCDESGEMCLAVALWNGRDHILKERLFGLTQSQGNHGEDVKELYYYQDSTPTHSYMRALYKYPQDKFPYDILIERNRKRDTSDPEFELLDTYILDKGCWNITAEYAKERPQDILCRYTIHNGGTKAATIDFLPTVWYRNTWTNVDCENSSIGEKSSTGGKQLSLKKNSSNQVQCSSSTLGDYVFAVDTSEHEAKVIFTENETNLEKLTRKTSSYSSTQEPVCSSLTPSSALYTKDAFHEYIVNGNKKSINPSGTGTKCAAVYHFTIEAGSQVTVNCRLFRADSTNKSRTLFGKHFDDVFNTRKRESDDFYGSVIPSSLSFDETSVARQAYAGLCWSKQLFIYNGLDMQRKGASKIWNPKWKHLRCHDVISMPDKWEFPWFATWDLAFHMIPLSDIDQQFAKSQLLLLLSDRFQHPNGQLPAYEFDFSDVNPPVHAWACLTVYLKTEPRDTEFLLTCFHKLSANFTWWLNAKDSQDTCMFNAGFLGMDNISCVNRSHPPPATSVDQVDGSAWMAFCSLCMMRIALELCDAVSEGKQVYEDLAVTYLGHFTRISQELNRQETGLWDSKDGFYYDRLNVDASKSLVLRIRSLVGLSALFATCIVTDDQLNRATKFARQLEEDRSSRHQTKFNGGVLLSLVGEHQLKSILRYLLDTEEFLSPFGIRSLSKFHKQNEFSVTVHNQRHSVSYCSAESNTDMFGGNSNWRGPIWLCMNYLLLEAIDIYDKAFTDSNIDLLPSQSMTSLSDVSRDIRKRLISIFVKDKKTQRRPVNGESLIHEDSVLFYEYIDAETGRGCGASHQTGWTALIANILQDSSK